MASYRNPFVSSMICQRHNSQRTNLTWQGWRTIQSNIVHSFMLWGFFGALVLAKPAPLPRYAHGVTAVAGTDLKADLRLEGRRSLSHNLRPDDFEVQLENGVGAVVADSEMKSTIEGKDFGDVDEAVVADSEMKSTFEGKDFGDVDVWEGEFQLEQDELDSAEGLKSIFGTNSEGFKNHKVRELGVEKGGPELLYLDTTATVDLKEKRNEAQNDLRNSRLGDDLFESSSENLEEVRALDRNGESETEMDVSHKRQAAGAAFQSRVKISDQEGKDIGRGTRKQKSKKDSSAPHRDVKRRSIATFVSQRSREEDVDLFLGEERDQISRFSNSTQRQAIKSPESESGSEVKHRSMKNDRKVDSTTEDSKHRDIDESKVKSDDVPSSDSDRLADGTADSVPAPLKDVDWEEIDENEQNRNLIPEYSLGEPVLNWDRDREQWLEDHPEVKPFTDDGRMRLFMLTGTQPWPCTKEGGDHLYLRFFKNKVDYCRIHGIDIFYNTALLHPDMPTFWAKLPVVRATMLSHPEVEWIWWLDADAIITDMEFEIPLEKYENYNMVVHGWENLVYEKKSWVALNAGSFLIRNCQWSMDFLERWASMGPQAPLAEAYRDILSDELPDRPRNPTDDQAALVFLLNAEKARWAGKVKVELEYFLNGYFVEMIDGFEAWEQKYREVEKEQEEVMEMVERGEVAKEKMVKKLGRAREKHVGRWGLRERRPFITHFTGCQPCTGNKNPGYSKEQCHDGAVRALNYGDDQVLRSLGYRHAALHLSDLVSSAAPQII